ncbi:MAG TPA: hypothetical protein VND80_11300 [Steroidobacteraceae bacterium]|nr:hypothetical protein [Steroidobacteraceae bacterium]
MRKKPRTRNPHEPLRHPDHPRPRTRREFLAQGFLSGAATVIAPSLLGLLAAPRRARATLAPDLQALLGPCGISLGAGLVPFIAFDLTGGGNIAGSNVLVGGPGGQLDFLSTAGYSKLGLPGTMIPGASTSGTTVDATFGLRYHADSAHLRGMKTRTGALAMSNTNGTVIPALSQNDTNINPLNPIYGIYQVGARGALLDLIGTDSTVSGGNSLAPATMINIAAQPTRVASSADVVGLVNTGQLSTLLPNPADVTAVMESTKRISDAKYAQVQAFTDPTADAAAKQLLACGYTKAAYVTDKYGSPSAVNPDLDPDVVGPSGIFNPAEYAANSDFQATAAVMKLVVEGNAAAGTIQLGGFDYHTGDRATGETRDFTAGECIGACLEFAARRKKPLMVYVFTDGSIVSNGMIDTSAAGRGKGVWTADNSNTAANYFLVFNPYGKPLPAQNDPEASLQMGSFTSDGSVNTTGSPGANNVFNLVQMVVLNYMALHGTQGNFPTLYPAPNVNDTLGTGAALDPLIAFAPLAGLVNGKIVG